VNNIANDDGDLSNYQSKVFAMEILMSFEGWVLTRRVCARAMSAQSGLSQVLFASCPEEDYVWSRLVHEPMNGRQAVMWS
jgi:hypothetical protein